MFPVVGVRKKSMEVFEKTRNFQEESVIHRDCGLEALAAALPRQCVLKRRQHVTGRMSDPACHLHSEGSAAAPAH